MLYKIDFLDGKSLSSKAINKLIKLINEDNSGLFAKEKEYFLGRSESIILKQTLLRRSLENKTESVCLFIVGDKILGRGGFGKVVSVPFYISFANDALTIHKVNYVVKIQQSRADKEAISLHARYRVYMSMMVFGSHYMVMDYMGASLDQYNMQGRSFQFRCELSLAISVELQRIHQNRRIHRDIKPQNILYDEEHQIVSIIDDGLSVRLGDDDNVCDVCWAGTRGYVPPESFVDACCITVAADIYALAGVFGYVWGSSDLLRYKHDRLVRGSGERMAKERFSLTGYLTSLPSGEPVYVIDSDLLTTITCLINNMQDQSPQRRPSLLFIQKFFTLIHCWKIWRESFAEEFEKTICQIDRIIAPHVQPDFLSELRQAQPALKKIASIKSFLSANPLTVSEGGNRLLNPLFQAVTSFFNNHCYINYYNVTAICLGGGEPDAFNLNLLQRLNAQLKYFDEFFLRCTRPLCGYSVAFVSDTDFCDSVSLFLSETFDIINMYQIDTVNSTSVDISQIIDFICRRYESYNKFCDRFKELQDRIVTIANYFEFSYHDELIALLTDQNCHVMRKISTLREFFNQNSLEKIDCGKRLFVDFINQVSTYFKEYHYVEFKKQFLEESRDPFKRASLREFQRSLGEVEKACLEFSTKVDVIRDQLDDEFHGYKNAGLVSMREIIASNHSSFFKQEQLCRVAYERLKHPLSLFFKYGVCVKQRPQEVDEFYKELAKQSGL